MSIPAPILTDDFRSGMIDNGMPFTRSRQFEMVESVINEYMIKKGFNYSKGYKIYYDKYLSNDDLMSQTVIEFYKLSEDQVVELNKLCGLMKQAKVEHQISQIVTEPKYITKETFWQDPNIPTISKNIVDNIINQETNNTVQQVVSNENTNNVAPVAVVFPTNENTNNIAPVAVVSPTNENTNNVAPVVGVSATNKKWYLWCC
jgi:hypothetical protein